MKNTVKTIAKTALKLLFSGALLFLVLKKTDLASIRDLLVNGNMGLLIAAMLLFIASKVISSFRLNIFLQSAGIKISQAFNLKLYWLGMFYNLFLPGGIGGDAYKAYFFNRKFGTPVKKSISALLFDRLSGLLALFALCFIFMLFSDFAQIPWYYALVLCAFMIIAFYVIIDKWFPEFYDVIDRTNFQSVIVQLLQVFSALLILKSIGVNTDISAYLFVFLVSSAVAVIPFTIGGIGAREITFMFASEFLGLDLSSSIALSLLFFVITAIISLAGAWYLINTSWTKSVSNQHLNDLYDIYHHQPGD